MNANSMEAAVTCADAAMYRGHRESTSMEVKVKWNDVIMEVSQVEQDDGGASTFWIGEDPACDHVVPAELLNGETRVSLARLEHGVLTAAALPGTSARLIHAGGACSLLDDDDKDSAGSAEGGEIYRLTLPPSSHLEVALAPWTFVVSTPPKEEKFKAPLELDWSSKYFLGVSGALHALFLLVFFLIPPDAEGLLFDSNESDSRFMKILLAPPEVQQQIVPEMEPEKEKPDSEDRGERHAGLAGKAGDRDSKKTDDRMGIKGPEQNRNIRLAREELKKSASSGGVLAYLTSAAAPTSPFGSDNPLGADPENALGDLTGERIGNSFGFGGLYSRGTGRGGGGDGTGEIGVGDLGKLVPGGCCGGKGGKLPPPKLGMRDPRRKGPVLTPGKTTVHGSLAKEVIRRHIRRSINQIKHCYEKGLARRPDLAGRVSVRFIISGTGAVQNSVVASSTVGDPQVASCIAGVVRRIAFPNPQDGGVVIVTYPFTLTSPQG